MSPLTRARTVLAVLAAIAAVVVLVSLAIGRVGIPLPEVLRILLDRIAGDAPAGTAATILLDVRLPRIAAAALIGAALALSGAAYQGLFRNPMVSPDMLGASAGAGFGAALAILLGGGMAAVQASAFAGGLAAVAIAVAVGAAVGRGAQAGIVVLVLAGMLVGTLFSAGIALAKFCADPNNTLPAITFWLMGGLADVRSGHLAWLAAIIACGAVPLLLLRWKLDLLCFGDEEAAALGVPVARLRLGIVACATLLTSAAVALCGIVGFVGLIVPHMARLLVGSRHADVLPAALLLGAAFLVVVDDVARCAFPVEIPLGILCALVGAPLFLYLLVRGRRRSWL